MVGAAQEQVHLHVHQPGQEGQVTDVDDHGVVRDPRRRHIEDPVAVDEQVARCHQFAPVHVEHAGAAQVDALRRVRAGHRMLL